MVEKTRLDNELRLVGEHIDYSRCVSLGFWVHTGSCNEEKDINGISHFIEHMLFKGTDRRSAKDLSSEMDAVGGQLNAFTSKECTCYYAMVTDEHVELALDILTDMLLNSKFDPIEIKKEKGVVAEEINMVEDTPEDLVHELLASAYYQEHPLGMTVLGGKKTLKGLSEDDINGYMKTQYCPNNVVLSVAGHYDAGMIKSWVSEHSKGWKTAQVNQCESKHIPKAKAIEKVKAIEQVHLCLGFPGLRRDDDDLYSLYVLNNLLGGGMSSRLFQKIREELGVAYSVYSYPSSYRDSGMFALYAGMKPDVAAEVANLIFDEIDDLRANGPSEEEFVRAREQLKGNTIIGRESVSGRMSSNGKAELLRGEVYSEEQIMEKIGKVSPESVKRVIDNIFDYSVMCSSLVGKPDKKNNLEAIGKVAEARK